MLLTVEKYVKIKGSAINILSSFLAATAVHSFQMYKSSWYYSLLSFAVLKYMGRGSYREWTRANCLDVELVPIAFYSAT